MTRLTNYLLPLLGLLALSCSQDAGISETDGRTGTLKISYSTTRAESSPEYDPMDHFELRVLNKDGGLLRKYTDSETRPEQLELLVGEYRAAVELGELSDASFEKRYYKGEKTFTVTPGTVTPIEVVCNIQNTVVETAFDKTVGTNFGSAYHVWVAAADTFDKTDAENGTVPALKYTAGNTKGYFTLPEGQTSMVWHFEGEHPTRGTIIKEGVIENLKASSKYVLTFKFSADIPGYIDDIQVTLDDKTDNWDDTLIFRPEPTIAGADFNINEVQKYASGEKQFNISTIGVMKNVELTIGEQTHTIFGDGATLVDGIRTEATNNRSLKVILSDQLFAGRSGGNNIVAFHITDEDSGNLTAYSTFRLQGVLPIRAENCDLWNNTIKVQALSFEDTADVALSLRKPGGDWQTLPGTKDAVQENDGESTYTATFTSEWESSTNDAGLAVHTLKPATAISAETIYEQRATIGALTSQNTSSTPAGPIIPGGDMEDGSMSCFNNDHGSFWDSGNNSMAGGLCSWSSYTGMAGSHCAKMSASKPIALVNLAAGNLFTGTFSLSGTSGTVDFGKEYDWQARPRALSVRYYAEKLGLINTNQHNGPLANGTQDQARIFVAIVDWSATHSVVSGSSAPSGVWDPTTMKSVDQGKIIAYGSIFIKEQSTGGEMIQTELPLYFYDKDIKPTGKYTLVISCATSAYGDYMNGNTSNVLFVDDFKWVY